MRERETIPAAAALPGFAGLLPPLGVLVAELAVRRAVPSSPVALFGLRQVALLYAGLILSFLGGMWWGIAATRVPRERLGRWLVLAVVPSLWAFAAALAGSASGDPVRGPRLVAALLALGLLGSLLVDRALARRELVPGWWLRLRVPLSVCLALLTLLAAVPA